MQATIRQAEKQSPSTCLQTRKAANVRVRGLWYVWSWPLRHGDFARLDVLGFGQSQRYKALLDLGADFVGVDRRIQLKCASEIVRTRFVMNQGSRTVGSERCPTT